MTFTAKITALGLTLNSHLNAVDIDKFSSPYNSSTNFDLYELNLCPATSLFDLKTDGYFRYPVDLFEPHLHKNLIYQSNSANEGHIIQSKLFNCTSQVNNGRPHPKHMCTEGIKRKCPVTVDYVKTAIRKSSSWMYPSEMAIPFLYNVWEAMMNRDAVIRVVVFGGSGAKGTEAGGCYCNPILDLKCLAFNHSAFHHSRSTTMDLNLPHCRWSNFFVKWLRTITDATIEPIYVTDGGALPRRAAVFMQDNFLPNKMGSLTRNDVIIFDYSMNEALTFGGTPQGNYQQHVELERAIRAAYTMTDVNENVAPTIILTETFGRRCGNYCNANESIPYTDTYDKVARYYHIPIFSFIDVLESTKLKHRNSIYNTLLVKGQHPLWYHHIFFADLFASVFASELRRSYEFALLNGQEDVQRRIKLLPLVKVSIPKPLSLEVDDQAVCDTSVPPLLDISADDFLSKEKSSHWLSRKTSPTIGWYSTNPSNSSSVWKLVEERGEKYGWVDEFNNSTDGGINHVLRFYLSDPDGNLFAKQKHLIIIKYLRTYSNAGKMRLQFCGQIPHNFYGKEMFFSSKIMRSCYLDSLWPNFHNNKISIPEYYTEIVQQGDVSPEKCYDAVKDQPGVSAETVDHKMSRISREIDHKSSSSQRIHDMYLDVIHEPICAKFGKRHDNGRCAARGPNEKVKVISVKICQYKFKE